MIPRIYSISKDSAVVIHKGVTHTVKRGAPNFLGLREALLSDKASDKDIEAHLRAGTSIEKWAKGRFKVVDDVILFDGDALPKSIQDRIFEMATKGEDPTRVFLFYGLLQKNPSNRSVEQLFDFLQNAGIPLTDRGTFLAYKSVRSDFLDWHSNTIDNHPGAVVEMPRNKISDDPDEGCHTGLHAGALEYARSFHGGGNIVIVEVDPGDVVSVPKDHSFQKMRVCKYVVIGVHGVDAPMSNTSVQDHEIPVKVKSRGGKRPKGFAKLDAMDAADLMKITLEALRVYASKGLQIMGASRIKGGKWALIQKIVSSRG